jgi:hypothetical protein
MDCEDTIILFEEYNDLLYYDGYSAEMRENMPEKYAAELHQFKQAHIVFPLVYNLID